MFPLSKLLLGRISFFMWGLVLYQWRLISGLLSTVYLHPVNNIYLWILHFRDPEPLTDIHPLPPPFSLSVESPNLNPLTQLPSYSSIWLLPSLSPSYSFTSYTNLNWNSISISWVHFRVAPSDPTPFKILGMVSLLTFLVFFIIQVEPFFYILKFSPPSSYFVIPCTLKSYTPVFCLVFILFYIMTHFLLYSPRNLTPLYWKDCL